MIHFIYRFIAKCHSVTSSILFTFVSQCKTNLAKDLAQSGGLVSKKVRLCLFSSNADLILFGDLKFKLVHLSSFYLLSLV